jgi:hypothetical protein
MQTIIYKSTERGHANHGWLNAYHSFSFASYYDPNKIHFGVLRVLNDDSVAASMGFGMHPHDNMEIITIPFSGILEHKDSMGNTGIISAGEVQVMSAGSGITHSEFNHSKTEAVTLFQIWIFPNKKNVTPRYDQIKYDIESNLNQFIQIISPNPNDEGSWIHQNAWMHIGKFTENETIQYTTRLNGNGFYLMVIDGEIEVADTQLGKRDAIGISEISTIHIQIKSATAQLLLMDIPMQVS